jgi:Domain of unknown function (DUF4340)
MIAAAVLAALCATMYWSNHHKPSEEKPAGGEGEVAPAILAVSSGVITQITLSKKGSAPVVLVKEKQGNSDIWRITAPQPLRADQQTVSPLAFALSSLMSQRLVESNADPADLGKYGLNEPPLEVDVTAKGKTYKVLVGENTPTHNGAYVRLEGDPRVFTISNYVKTDLDKHLDDLRDKRLLTLEADKVNRIELSAGKQEIELDRSGEKWQIVKPQPMRADNAEVDELLRKITSAKMQSGTEAREEREKQAAAAFASGSPIATIKLTGDAGTQELQLRKAKSTDDYYAKSSMSDEVSKVTKDLADAADKKPDDFRNKKLFDMGAADPEKIAIRDSGKDTYLTRSGDDWWSGDGKKLGAGSVDSLLEKLRDLQAEKLVDSGFANPVLEISVISNGGKSTEKLQIVQNGEHYIARREGEPTLYSLDSKAMEDLRKAVGELKPEAAAKAK